MRRGIKLGGFGALVVLAVLALAAPTASRASATPTRPTTQAAGVPTPSIPAPTLAEGAKVVSSQDFEAWTYRCIAPPAANGAGDGQAATALCELSQQVAVRQDDKPQAVMALGVSRLPDGGHGLTIWTPLGVRIKPGLSLEVDQGAPTPLAFDFCGPRGCWIASTPIDAQVPAMTTGKLGRARLVLANGQPLAIEFSLAGLTAGLAALDAGKPAPPVSTPATTKPKSR
jgi:invasion protein IalB